MKLAVFGYKGTSAGRQTGGCGTVTGGPFTAGDAIVGAGGRSDSRLRQLRPSPTR